MKLLAITCLAVLLGALASIFAADDRIEIGTFITKNGVRVSAVYCILKGRDTEVHLLFPEGKNIQVDVESGTSSGTMDRALQQIADEQTSENTLALPSVTVRRTGVAQSME
jgi:hypothetical protein